MSEGALVDLQESFLEPGLHEIQVKHHDAGVVFITKFLQTLTHFTGSNCGILYARTNTSFGLVTQPNQGLIKNIYDELEHYTQQTDGTEAYLLTHFYYDLLIIELSPVLEQVKWFKKFIHLLVSLKFTQQIPVLVISYL